jgi:aryl-alcohol dehydrogenase-like predicted oxidoreductase
MHELVVQGKVLYWGTSEWSAEEIAEAYGVANAHHLTPPTMEQPQYNLFEREKVEREFRRLYETFGMGTTIWSPLASGILTGKYAKGVPSGSRMSLPDYAWLKERLESAEGRARVAKARALEPITKDLGATLAQLSIAWCLANPHVSSVILGATRPAQLTENLAALEVLPKLTPEVLARIESIVASRPAAKEED